jgi:hypothetical protein
MCTVAHARNIYFAEKDNNFQNINLHFNFVQVSSIINAHNELRPRLYNHGDKNRIKPFYIKEENIGVNTVHSDSMRIFSQ